MVPGVGVVVRICIAGISRGTFICRLFVNILLTNMSTVVSVRVPERLKKEMQKLKDVDWPALVKSAIEERLRRERLKTLWKDIEDLRAKVPPSPDPDFSTRSIRQDRGR
jgi:hypothetical protein